MLERYTFDPLTVFNYLNAGKGRPRAEVVSLLIEASGIVFPKKQTRQSIENIVKGRGRRSGWSIPHDKFEEFARVLRVGDARDEFRRLLAGSPPGSPIDQDAQPFSVPINDTSLTLNINPRASRIRDEDGAGVRDNVDFRVEECWITNALGQDFGERRQHVRASYPTRPYNDDPAHGVVAHVLEGDTGLTLLPGSIRPACRRLMVETVRGFPGACDRDSLAAVLAEMREELGGVVRSFRAKDGGVYDAVLMGQLCTDSGKLSDVVKFYAGVVEHAGGKGLADKGWQLGYVRVDTLSFLKACSRGGGEGFPLPVVDVVKANTERLAEWRPSTVCIEDMFTVLAGQFSRSHLPKLKGKWPKIDEVIARAEREGLL